MMGINEVDIELIVSAVIGAEGDLNVAAERMCLQLEQAYGTITESDIRNRLAALDKEGSDSLVSKLRNVVTLKLFWLVGEVGKKLYDNIDGLRPAELARTYTSLTSTFHTVTAPATKVVFDFDNEAMKLAEELNIPVDEVKSDIKNIQRRIETGFSKKST